MLDMNKLNAMLTRLTDVITEPYVKVGWEDSRYQSKVRQAQADILSYVAQHRTPAPHAPFNEAAARAGKPIEARINGVWQSAHFVGMDSCGTHAVVESGACVLIFMTLDCMRMAVPKMRTLYVNASSEGVQGFYLSEEAAKKDAEKRGYPIAAYPVQLPDVE